MIFITLKATKLCVYVHNGLVKKAGWSLSCQCKVDSETIIYAHMNNVSFLFFLKNNRRLSLEEKPFGFLLK